MAKKSKRMTPKKKGISGQTALLVGGGLLGLYLITRPGAAAGEGLPAINIFGQPGEPGAPGAPGQSILQTWTNEITKTIAGTTVGVAEAPGAIIFGVPKKIVEVSEEQTYQQVFGGVPRTGVSAFMAAAPPGSIFAQPVTYPQFMAEQPITFRAAAAAGNILTGQAAAQYGAYVAEETKKGQAMAGIPAGQFEQRFAAMPTKVRGPIGTWGGQALVGLGQALTVPFGGGGAAGWGAAIATKWPQWQYNP